MAGIVFYQDICIAIKSRPDPKTVGCLSHASSRAALIYLHSTDDRQRSLAEAVSQRALRDLAGESCGMSVA